MTGVALHAVQPAAVDRHHGALHVNQITLAQRLAILSTKHYAKSIGPLRRPRPVSPALHSPPLSAAWALRPPRAPDRDPPSATTDGAPCPILRCARERPGRRAAPRSCQCPDGTDRSPPCRCAGLRERSAPTTPPRARSRCSATSAARRLLAAAAETH